jgi:hypothetical protein
MALVLFALWPLVHRGLVARYDLNPWKFMGFAMYCIPRVFPLVEVHAHYGERRAPVAADSGQVSELPRELARFITFRQVWGDLLSPDRIGEVVGATLTRADQIEVVVTSGFVDRGSWRVAARTQSYFYQPPEPSALDPGQPRGGRLRQRTLRRLSR